MSSAAFPNTDFIFTFPVSGASATLAPVIVFPPVQKSSSDELVREYYPQLFRFALSLSRSPDDASDLTQQTFFIWMEKGHQLRDGSKAKTWLFTTLYREFIRTRRKQAKFVDQEMDADEHTPSDTTPDPQRQIDGALVQEALGRLREEHRTPLTLFYFKQHSYKDIAGILDIPIGTVMSRISRGKSELRRLIDDPSSNGNSPEGDGR